MSFTILEEPKDYFKGVGQCQLATPTDILLFTRTTKEKLQQEALQNRSHHRFVLTFNMETKGHVHVDNRVFDFMPSQTLLILPYQFHHFSHLGSSQLHWLFCTFEFKAETFLEPLRNRVVETSNHIQIARDALLEEWQRDERQDEQLQTALIRLLLTVKQGGQVPDETRLPGSRDSLLRSINRLMSQWRGKTVLVVHLAEELNLSESRLRALFKATAGIPLGRYILNYRLNRAMALLRTTGLPIADVAEEAGFGSPQAFCRIFKKETGRTPLAYRKQ